MPTVRGWAAVGAAAALVVLWIGFGERLVLAVAALLVVAVVAGVLYVRRFRPGAAVSRTITPVQVHDGDHAIVEVRLTTRGRLSQVVFTDVVEGLGTAEFLAERVEAGSPLIARYEVVCRPRGIYRIGPARLQLRDAVGFAEAGGDVGTIDRLVVYPAYEEFEGLPVVRGQDPTVNIARANFSHTGGEEFFTLREYQDGDDLRRVHWPSSARRDTLMIKQLEMPWQARALVLVDHRAEVYPTPDHFEHAVRGAASVIRHLYRNGFTPTLWAGGPATATATTSTYDAAMERLATVASEPGVELASTVARLRREGVGGGALVLVTGSGDEDVLAAYRLLSRDFLRTVVLAVAQDQTDEILHLRRSGVVVVRVAPSEHWAPRWRDTMEHAWSTAGPG